MLAAPSVSFPWKSIWCVKVPKRVAFFLWIAARGGVLTIDNLVKKKLPLVNWCCLCRGKEEIVDHLLIHRKYAHTLWSEILLWFGVQWVMLKSVVSLLSAWWNWLGSHTSKVWNMVPACLMWLIWKEHNACTFEDTKRLVDCVKSLLLRTLFEWSHIWGFPHCHSLFDFLNSVSLSFLIGLYSLQCSEFTIVNSLYLYYQ